MHKRCNEAFVTDIQDVWYDSSTVAYWNVITDFNTLGKGGLDVNSGQFTAGYHHRLYPRRHLAPHPSLI